MLLHHALLAQHVLTNTTHLYKRLLKLMHAVRVPLVYITWQPIVFPTDIKL